jgi:2-polyprenyl-6-methoxyphenol hydroxylase-like FAD-dependent oxidoreductase
VDYERNFYKVLDLVPSFAERVRAGKREERFFAMSDMPNFFRQPYGPGWALVGDAGYHQDPITAEGMTDAFRDAEILVDAIDDGFAGRRPLEQALAAYEQKRNQAAMPLYAFTCQAARCDPVPPERISLFSALKGNQADTNRLFGIGAGTTPISEFMAPENIQRIMAAAA